MSGRYIARFALAILASWLVQWLVRNRLPEPLTQGLAFWVLFMILPLSFAAKETAQKPSLVQHLLAATAGGAVVLVLNLLLGGWSRG